MLCSCVRCFSHTRHYTPTSKKKSWINPIYWARFASGVLCLFPVFKFRDRVLHLVFLPTNQEFSSKSRLDRRRRRTNIASSTLVSSSSSTAVRSLWNSTLCWRLFFMFGVWLLLPLLSALQLCVTRFVSFVCSQWPSPLFCVVIELQTHSQTHRYLLVTRSAVPFLGGLLRLRMGSPRTLLYLCLPFSCSHSPTQAHK